MSATTHTMLLLIAALMLGSAALAGILALRLHGQQQRYQARVALVIGGRGIATEAVFQNARRQADVQAPWVQRTIG